MYANDKRFVNTMLFVVVVVQAEWHWSLRRKESYTATAMVV